MCVSAVTAQQAWTAESTSQVGYGRSDCLLAPHVGSNDDTTQILGGSIRVSTLSYIWVLRVSNYARVHAPEIHYSMVWLLQHFHYPKVEAMTVEKSTSI